MIQKKKGRAEYSPGRLGSLDPELTELSSVAERTSTVKNRKTKEETGLCGTGGLSNGCRRKRKDPVKPNPSPRFRCATVLPPGPQTEDPAVHFAKFRIAGILFYFEERATWREPWISRQKIAL